MGNELVIGITLELTQRNPATIEKYKSNKEDTWKTL